MANGRLSRGDLNILWIETHCRIPEGKDVGKPVKLRDWQKDEIRKIYDNPHGTRRAIVSFGRKNAKTTLAAFLLLLHTCGPEAKPNSQLNSAAQSKDQAAILFKLAAKVVRLSPTLNPVIIIRDTIKELFCPELGTLYKALSADASTAYGLSPVFIVHDELGQVKGPRSELYDALETAVGAHDNPLSIVISTQAPTDGDLLSVLIDDALAGNDPRVVLSLYTADPSDDPFVEATIRKANPAFGDFLNATEVLAMAEDARRMPSRESEYRNLILNQRVDRNDPFISRSIWLANGEEPASEWGDAPVWAGLDLSSTSDLTAFVPMAWINGGWHVDPVFWLPDEGLVEKSRTDRVPYDVWAKDGHLQTTPGRSIQYEFVAEYLHSYWQEHRRLKVAFDKWGMKHLTPWLEKAGFTPAQIEEVFVPFGQGFGSISPAMRDLEGALLESQVRHGQHPVLTMCMANAVVTTDPYGNRKLNKAKAAGRIDGAVALTMAFGIAPDKGEAPPSYQMLII